MRPRWVPLLLLAVLSAALPLPARAGGPLCDDDEEIEAEKAYRSWRRRGRRALPSAIKALLSESPCMSETGRSFVEGIGMPAAEPLAAALLEAEAPSPAGALALALILRDHGADHEAARDRIGRRLVSGIAGGDREEYYLGTYLLPSLPDELVDEGVRHLGKVVDDGSATAPRLCLAYGALRGAGPAGAPALPALRRRLARASLDEKVHIARVVGALGTEGAKARPQLVGLIPALHERARKGSEAPGWPGSLEEPWIDCELSTGLGPLATALDSLRRLETPSPEGGDPEVLAVLRDEELPMRQRRWAALLVDRWGRGLDPEDERLAELVLRKDELSRTMFLSDVVVPQVGPIPPPPPHSELHDLYAALGVCRAEAEQPAIPLETVAETAAAAPVAARETMTSCLENRLCGPDGATAAATISRCCRESFGAAPPPLCASYGAPSDEEEPEEAEEAPRGPPPVSRTGGCACRASGRAPPGLPILVLVVLATAALARTRSV